MHSLIRASESSYRVKHSGMLTRPQSHEAEAEAEAEATTHEAEAEAEATTLEAEATNPRGRGRGQGPSRDSSQYYYLTNISFFLNFTLHFI